MIDPLYRAKRTDNGEWIEGYYAKVTDYLTEEYVHVIIPSEVTLYPRNELSGYHEVFRETVCRLLDHADYDSFEEVPRLFQNDIIGVWDRHEDVNNTDPRSVVLVRDEHSVTDTTRGLGRWFPQDTTRIKLLGNAYDNPELLNGYGLSHFVCYLNDYDGDWREYHKEHDRLTKKYDIHGAHACCYLCNFESEYICHLYNGGCSKIDTCREIYKHEGKRF